MKIRSRFLSIGLFATSLAAFLVLTRLPAAPFQLGSATMNPDKTFQLSLTGDVNAAYSIEASSNLSDWFLISSGIATNGLLTLHHGAASNYPALFYRGKETNVSLPLTLDLKKDTNFSVSSLVSLDGGSSVLYASNGVRFTIHLPSNSIPDAQILSATLVTNITGLPFARGTFAAVQIEPADIAFWGAASLEITFPTNTDRREVISFTCRPEGSAFQLTPDRVGSDRVVIGITHGGVFGSSLATTQELANAASILPPAVQPVAGAPAPKRLQIAPASSSTAECFPEKQLAANQAKAQIDAARAVSEVRAAAILGAERQKQLANQSDDSSAVLAQVETIICDFYNAQIAPRWAEANNNCSLGAILIQNTLGLERQRQLLGADPTDGCTDMSKIPFCAIFQSCLEDIRECCSSGKKGPKKVAEVLGLMRQDQLLGLNCISQTQGQDVIDLCSSNAWTGSFSMIETGSVHTTTNIVYSPLSTGVQTGISEFTSRFDGAIEDSQETGSPEFGYLVELKVSGPVSQHEFHLHKDETFVSVEYCRDKDLGGTQHDTALSQTEHSAAGNTTYSISFIVLPDAGGFVTFNAINFDPDNPTPPKGTVSLIQYQDVNSPCTGLTIVQDSTFVKESPFFGNTGLTDLTGNMADPNVVSGSYSMDNPLEDPPRHLQFNWNFTRHVVTP